MKINALKAYEQMPAVRPGTSATTAAAPRQDAGSDRFEHTAAAPESAAYAGTMYTRSGTPEGEPERILPERYYSQLSAPHVGYKGSMISYAELLEEAVSSGQMTLDENESVFANFERAEQLLIWDKVRPLFPWSGTRYTEDGQYVCRIEGGQVTGARLAYYYDSDGRKITTQYLAEQLASGVYPADLDGSYTFLHDTDPELYFKALEIGSARRSIQDGLEQLKLGTISEKQFLEDIDPLIILLFGKNGNRLSLTELRQIIVSEDFGSRMLQSLGTLPEERPDHDV